MRERNPKGLSQTAEKRFLPARIGRARQGVALTFAAWADRGRFEFALADNGHACVAKSRAAIFALESGPDARMIRADLSQLDRSSSPRFGHGAVGDWGDQHLFQLKSNVTEPKDVFRLENTFFDLLFVDERAIGRAQVQNADLVGFNREFCVKTGNGGIGNPEIVRWVPSQFVESRHQLECPGTVDPPQNHSNHTYLVGVY
jgi:hypothetical protein